MSSWAFLVWWDLSVARSVSAACTPTSGGGKSPACLARARVRDADAPGLARQPHSCTPRPAASRVEDRRARARRSDRLSAERYFRAGLHFNPLSRCPPLFDLGSPQRGSPCALRPTARPTRAACPSTCRTPWYSQRCDASRHPRSGSGRAPLLRRGVGASRPGLRFSRCGMVGAAIGPPARKLRGDACGTRLKRSDSVVLRLDVAGSTEGPGCWQNELFLLGAASDPSTELCSRTSACWPPPGLRFPPDDRPGDADDLPRVCRGRRVFEHFTFCTTPLRKPRHRPRRQLKPGRVPDSSFHEPHRDHEMTTISWALAHPIAGRRDGAGRCHGNAYGSRRSSTCGMQAATCSSGVDPKTCRTWARPRSDRARFFTPSIWVRRTSLPSCRPPIWPRPKPLQVQGVSGAACRPPSTASVVCPERARHHSRVIAAVRCPATARPSVTRDARRRPHDFFPHKDGGG